jgi:MATE family multidrug resistance protein
MGVWGWWAFDIFTLIASYMAISIVAAQTILRTIGLITFMLPVGISSACSTLVGNSVGEGSADRAIQYYKTCMVFCLILAAVQVIILFVFQEDIILFYTTQADISEQMSLAWPVLMVFVVFDCTQGVQASVIRSTGKQKLG